MDHCRDIYFVVDEQADKNGEQDAENEQKGSNEFG